MIEFNENDQLNFLQNLDSIKDYFETAPIENAFARVRSAHSYLLRNYKGDKDELRVELRVLGRRAKEFSQIEYTDVEDRRRLLTQFLYTNFVLLIDSPQETSEGLEIRLN